ncbi:MAG: HD domain-containing phosphohydrolase [Balneolaceae bacterium]|nr:HD domain-containing phosphohydrolase [Balneolaceae bacterium]
MIKDVKSYFQTVASRLSNAFSVEDFDTESELEFWSLAAEHISRKETPKFTEIVQWIDLIYHAPIHFVYKKVDGEKLRLYRRQVLVENIENVTGDEGEELTEKQQQQVRKYEEQLEQIEKQISWSDEFLNIGTSNHTIGKCEHIPVYKDDELWAIYCVGPHVRSPDRIKAKLPIVARILSNWLAKLESRETKPSQSYEAKAEQVASDLGTGTLNIDRIANLMLGYLAKLKSASFGGIIEQSEAGIEFLAIYKLEERFIDWVEENMARIDSAEQLSEIFSNLPETILRESVDDMIVSELSTEHAQAFIFIGLSGEIKTENEIETTISTTLRDLLKYRKQNRKISDELIYTYYKMLRQLEMSKERTRHHTPRMIAFAKRFGEHFGLDEQELNRLILAAKLHDVGYIVTQQLDEKMTMGAELEHPFVGSMIVEALPVHKDVKEGIKTHHEWINGSGTPYGLTGEEISWTGKIIGLFEFVNEFIETHQYDDSKSDKEWIEILSEELIERAENQFDMVLVPTAIELIRSLGWEGCCTLASEAEN